MNPAAGIDKSRYELLAKIASGGMGTVYVGRQRGAGGFKRLVAVKRAHPHLLEQRSFSLMLVKEAELSAAIHHPNAVSVLDVEELEGELLLVMEYVDGVPLSTLIERLDPADDEPVPPRVAVRILLDACAGLQACHTATDDHGEELGLVHRDVTPQNVLVGADGQARLTDFGIAKSLRRDDKLTQTGTVRGKSGYMAPEYVADGKLDRRSDVFGLGVVAWETLVGLRLFRGKTDLETLKRITERDAPLVSERAPWIGDALDEVIATALQRDPDKRFDTAEAFANALEHAAREADMVGRHREVGDLISDLFGDMLRERRTQVRAGATLPPGMVTGTMTAAAAMDGPASEREPSTLEASTLSHLDTTPKPRRHSGWLAAGALAIAAVIGAVVFATRSESDAPETKTSATAAPSVGATPTTVQPDVAPRAPSAQPQSTASPESSVAPDPSAIPVVRPRPRTSGAPKPVTKTPEPLPPRPRVIRGKKSPDDPYK